MKSILVGFAFFFSIAVAGLPAQRIPRPVLAAQVTAHSVTLDCTASTTTGVTGYNVERRTGTGNVSQLNNTLLPACHYVDLAVLPGASYTYTMRAVGSTGVESLDSNPVVAAIPADPPPPPPPPGCVTSTPGSFTSTGFAAQTAPFTATFQATPMSQTMDAVIGLSRAPVTSYTGLAAIVRFVSSSIDARNGGAYASATPTPFTAGVTYTFRLVVTPATHRYDAFVRAGAGAEAQIAAGYAFRTEQATLATLADWVTTAEQGSVQVCGFAITGTAPPPPVTISIAPNPVSIIITTTKQFAATVLGTTNTAVTWTATGGTISAAGLYTAGNVPGTYAVTARSVADTTKSAAATVTIPTPVLTVACPAAAAAYTGANFPPGSTITISGTVAGRTTNCTATLP